MTCAEPLFPECLSTLGDPPDDEALDAAVCLWHLCRVRAEVGTGFLPFSVPDAAFMAGVAFELVEPALDALAGLGVLVATAPLCGAVPFRLNLDPPGWAVDAASARHQFHLREALRGRPPFSLPVREREGRLLRR